jgi:tRNA(Ile)-lysidine synthase
VGLLEQEVAAFIRANGIFPAPSRVLLAVSGGADSIGLLYVMYTLKLQGFIDAELFCVHIDHQLRGVQSRDDAAFVTQQANHLGIPCTIKTYDVRTYAKQCRLSIETAGREIRSMCFAEVAQSLRCNWIATGHQKDDNAETVLLRLRRGTGYRGLRGIQPVRTLKNNVMLARPLLSSRRSEIVTYLKDRHLAWREDHTNADCTYARNFVRHRLLASLQRECRRDLVDELTGLAGSASRLYNRIRLQAEQAAKQSARLSAERVTIDAHVLTTLPEPVATELIRMQLVQLGCGERDLTRRHYTDILQLAHSRKTRGAVSLPDGYTARRDHDRVILEKPPLSGSLSLAPERVEIPIPGKASFDGYELTAEILAQEPGQPIQIPADKSEYIEYLDLDCVGRPLVVRKRKAGDVFRPLGQTGVKKVGKFLTAAKVTRERRERVILFDDGWRIIWVCPVRISEEVRLTEKTTRVLTLSVREEEHRS